MDQKLREWYLQNLDIDCWQLRNKTIALDSQDNDLGAKTSIHLEPNRESDVINNLDWESLKNKVVACQACHLHKTRKNVVFGVGNIKAELCIVGEAPGANEDLQGEPFVGRAGKLLDQMLKAIGLEREQIYIANILKCRPPQNRDPLPEEVETCTPFLQRQLALIKPKLILAVGRIAAHFLLETHTSLNKLRTTIFSYGNLKTPLIVTYHPAYLLRSPKEKSKAYEDLLRVKEMLR